MTPALYPIIVKDHVRLAIDKFMLPMTDEQSLHKTHEHMRGAMLDAFFEDEEFKFVLMAMYDAGLSVHTATNLIYDSFLDSIRVVLSKH